MKVSAASIRFTHLKLLVGSRHFSCKIAEELLLVKRRFEFQSTASRRDF